MTKKEITQLSYQIIGCAIKVHKMLGPGLLESVYHKCLEYELDRSGYDVKREVKVSVNYEDIYLDTELRIDLIVNDLIVLELKAVAEILPIHEAQLLTYMKLLKKPQGLLINFHSTSITKSVKPFVNEYFRDLLD
jgi:GxxExxY protein